MGGRIPSSRVVLIEAGTWRSRSTPRFRPDCDYPAFGLLSLEAIVRAHGYEVLLVDLVRGSWDADRLQSDLRASPPVAIGVSAYTEGAELACEVIRSCKSALPGCPVVAGGPHFTFLPEEGLDAGAEVVVLYEGEGPLIAVLEHLKAPEALPVDRVRGVAFRRNGKLHRTPPRERINGLDHLPFSPKLVHGQSDKSKVHVLSSRGCPGRCLFCASGAFSGRRARCESAERVFSMLWAAPRVRQRQLVVSFVDDIFTVDRRRLGDVFRWAKDAGLGIQWEARCRVDQMTGPFLRFLADAGCRSLHLGVESADQAVLDSLDKRISIESFFANYEHLLTNGIEPRCSFMIGHHTDTRASIERTVVLAAAIEARGIGVVVLGISTPFPGTPLRERASALGVTIPARNWRTYSTRRPVCTAPGFSSEDLRRALHLFEEDKERVLSAPFLTTGEPGAEEFREQVLNWAERMSRAVRPGPASRADGCRSGRP